LINAISLPCQTVNTGNWYTVLPYWETTIRAH